MIQAGVSMLDSVRLTSGVCGSPKYESMWKEVNERLERGQQLSESLADYKQVPKAINKMLGAGERSGKLGTVMENVSSFCEAELSVAIKTMTSLLEPAIVMFLGVVVGGLVLALLLPIFTISKAMH
jgi:type IV pilus assembly protein PilC